MASELPQQTDGTFESFRSRNDSCFSAIFLNKHHVECEFATFRRDEGTESVRIESQTIHYLNIIPKPTSSIKGIIVLIHGFPQTHMQFRHVACELAEAGYHVIAPDYTGAGYSSQPIGGFEKAMLANDLRCLVWECGVIQDEWRHLPLNIIGIDIGGMIAYAWASRYAYEVNMVILGECAVPGTRAFDNTKSMPQNWHLGFHEVPDLPEALVKGNETMYIDSFFRRFLHNQEAIYPAEVEDFAVPYRKPGAMRCAFELYRAFEADAADNKAWIEEHGKCPVPALILSGRLSHHAGEAEMTLSDLFDVGECGFVPGAGHFIAEEGPAEFLKIVLWFLEDWGAEAALPISSARGSEEPTSMPDATHSSPLSSVLELEDPFACPSPKS